MLEFGNMNGTAGSVFVRPEDVIRVTEHSPVNVAGYECKISVTLIVLAIGNRIDEAYVYGVCATRVASRVRLAYQSRLTHGGRPAIVEGIDIHAHPAGTLADVFTKAAAVGFTQNDDGTFDVDIGEHVD